MRIVDDDVSWSSLAGGEQRQQEEEEEEEGDLPVVSAPRGPGAVRGGVAAGLKLSSSAPGVLGIKGRGAWSTGCFDLRAAELSTWGESPKMTWSDL